MLETIVGWRFDLLNSQLFIILEEKTLKRFHEK